MRHGIVPLTAMGLSDEGTLADALLALNNALEVELSRLDGRRRKDRPVPCAFAGNRP